MQISGKVSAALSDITNKARKMDELIGEIATATAEQNQGIGQINMAVGQLDTVTQAAANNSNTGAEAAEEMRQQAIALQGGIADLKQLIGEGAATTSASLPMPNPAATRTQAAAEKSATRATAKSSPSSKRSDPAKTADPLPMPGAEAPGRFQDF